MRNASAQELREVDTQEPREADGPNGFGPIREALLPGAYAEASGNR